MLIEGFYKMNVVINAFSARRGGGQTYLLNLLQHLKENDDIKIFLLAPDSLQVPSNSKIVRVQVNWPTENPLLRSLWERRSLPRLLQKLNADILFCPGGVINTTVPKGCKTVTMFRNMIPFDPVQRAKYPLGLMRMRNWLLERVMLKSMINADLIIFISNFARQIVEERAGRHLKSAVTIPHGISSSFKIADNDFVRRPEWLPAEDYLLYVSIFDVYKNQLEVVQGFHLLKQMRETREKLILAGHSSSDYGLKVKNEIERLGMQDDVILAGNIPYTELPNVYYHAKLNIFASECENCPNILLEALGAGQPLLVSNRQPMPEFGGDAAIYFDPTSPEDIADKLISIIDDPLTMESLSKKARERSIKYDWKNTADETWRAIISLNNSKELQK